MSLNIEIKSFKDCINKDLYNMYQDIPKNEIGSTNILYGVSFEEFKNICKKMIKEEKEINITLTTTTNRYILYVDNKPVGEFGIRTTLNDFWIKRGSQIYYKIRKSERGKGYGDIIFKYALMEAKRIGFNRVRVNCNTKNIYSKKIILKNGGKLDIEKYKTKEGFSNSYIIDLNDKKV